MRNDNITVWQEHQFWLEILNDHAIFVRDFLGAEETQWLAESKKYIALFQQSRSRLMSLGRRLPANSEVMTQFARNAYSVAHGYFQLEGRIQSLRIANEVNIALSPTYFNGTLNENAEYLRQLRYFVRGEVPPPLPLVELLDLWLEDQLGHAALLIEALDLVEEILIQEIKQLEMLFQAHIVKNEAIKGYLRFTKPGFPVQKHFAKEVSKTVNRFTQVVEKVIRMYQHDTVLDQTTLRFLEHHLPEACYFLIKLSQYAEITFPPCKLTKPSFQ